MLAVLHAGDVGVRAAEVQAVVARRGVGLDGVEARAVIVARGPGRALGAVLVDRRDDGAVVDAADPRVVAGGLQCVIHT